MKKTRLHELGLPPDIIDIARNHRDLPPKARERVLASIQGYNEEIAVLRAQISKLEIPKAWYIREELRAKLLVIEVKVHACRSLLTVMRRMPLETMGEIFEYCLLPGGDPTLYRGDSDDEDSDSEGGTVTTAGLLCLVCKYWKTVAAATPALWSDIHVKAVQHSWNAVPLVDVSNVRAIWARMERVSHPWRLSIEIGQTEELGGDKDKIIGLPLHQLLNRPASLHLQRLAITGSEYTWSLGMDEISFPRVTSLIYHCRTTCASRTTTPVAFPAVPNLTQAILNNIFIINILHPDADVSLKIPWSQLTHLSLGGELELNRWKSVFKQCTALQKGCFWISNFDEEANCYSEPAEANFPDLTELVFMHSSPFQTSLAGVSTPALTKLRMYTNWGEPCLDLSNPNLYGSLTHLSLICTIWLTGDFMFDILKTVPQLEELFFPFASGLKQVLEFLTYGHEGKFALRRLKALGMILCTNLQTDYSDEEDGVVPPPFPMNALVDMAASRTQAVKDERFSSVPYTLAPLNNLVVRLDVHWSDVKVRSIREMLAPLASYDLKSLVYGSWAGFNTHGSVHLGGASPRAPSREKHWEDNFMEFLDNIEEYSLFPTLDNSLV